jgi:hypothetical protein
MSLQQKKQQFIRWYYGEFVYDPHSEVFNFGIKRPLAAVRLSRFLRCLGIGR